MAVAEAANLPNKSGNVGWRVSLKQPCQGPAQAGLLPTGRARLIGRQPNERVKVIPSSESSPQPPRSSEPDHTLRCGSEVERPGNPTATPKLGPPRPGTMVPEVGHQPTRARLRSGVGRQGTYGNRRRAPPRSKSLSHPAETPGTSVSTRGPSSPSSSYAPTVSGPRSQQVRGRAEEFAPSAPCSRACSRGIQSSRPLRR